MDDDTNSSENDTNDEEEDEAQSMLDQDDEGVQCMLVDGDDKAVQLMLSAPFNPPEVLLSGPRFFGSQPPRCSYLRQHHPCLDLKLCHQ
ncbi:hypothetical protein CF327_g7268 [Tilletia walkeri]|nr:hypothetical protein CF327_g7268 [Tilletia walkeri]